MKRAKMVFLFILAIGMAVMGSGCSSDQYYVPGTTQDAEENYTSSISAILDLFSIPEETQSIPEETQSIPEETQSIPETIADTAPDPGFEEDRNTGGAGADTVHALNALLIGVPFYSGQQVSGVSQWPEEAVQDTIYSKLIRDDYLYSDSSYLRETGLNYQTDEDGYWHFDLDLVQKITQDTLGRDYPGNAQKQHCFVSGDELLIMPAFGESTSMIVQDFISHGNIITAVGTAVYNSNINSELRGYFQAVFEENPSSVYGYTLVSLDHIEENQSFHNLAASASSQLQETTATHYAARAIDGDPETAWVEGVHGVGEGEWIRLETTDGSKMEVSAIEFSLGYQKSDQLLQKNGWPTQILIECEDGYQCIADFLYYDDVVIINPAVKTSWIKFTILDALAGTKYDDTCISEIRLHGMDLTTYFQTDMQNSQSNAPFDVEEYVSFVQEGAYLPFVDDSGLVGEPSEYCIADIDQDGVPELLLYADDGWGFCMTYVFSVDNETQSITLIDSIYSYAGISYSEADRYISYCYTKPTVMEGGREFFQLYDGAFILSFGIYYTDYDHYSLVQYNPDGSVAEESTLSEEQWKDYVNSGNDLDWKPIG